jgi:hypothetical protein
MPETRLNLRRLASALFLGVILPISIALLIDLMLGTLPLVTIVGIVIFMPLGALWLGRVSLSELNRVIDVVAPVEDPASDVDEAAADETAADEAGSGPKVAEK